MAELLLEIGTEEIPARMLRKAESDLTVALEVLLEAHQLKHTPLQVYGAPRQLFACAKTIATRQEDRLDTLHGPPARIAYDQEGKPSRALQAFLRKNPQLEANQLFMVEQPKGQVVAGRLLVPGRDTIDLLAAGLPEVLQKMHFTKNMRWGDCPTRFVRPVRSILALFDGTVIPFSFANVAASNLSFGHRYCGKTPFEVTTIDQYFSEKEKQGIIVRHQDRRDRLTAQLQVHMNEIGAQLVADEDLLAEIADLVELPYAVLGSFNPSFLKIPKEVLVTSLRDHQKSFCVQDEDLQLMPHFLAVASIKDDLDGLVRKGNEWVLNGRLFDAKFFWESDLKKNFERLREQLKELVFQTKIGSYYEKTERIAKLCGNIAASLDWSRSRLDDLDYAARHCKTDLTSELVFEFPELQGKSGGLLLIKKGMPNTIADAVYDHYLPQSMDDQLPRSKAGALVSLADKLDTLVGCFAVGLIPTGTKDPYALRRATQGIVRLLIEYELPLSLKELIQLSLATYEQTLSLPPDLMTTLRDFFLERIRYYFKRLSVPHQHVAAVLATEHDRVDQTHRRIGAISAQMEKASFTTLALNLKRMKHVIADELEHLPEFKESLLKEEPEKKLWQAYWFIKAAVETATTNREYNKAMDLMVTLADPVERYFSTDGVYVNDEDARLRHNRKAMLRQISTTLSLVADISYLG